MVTMLNKIRSVMFGHAIADAVGVPVEFRSREYLDRNPVTDMIGFGTYNLPAGCWSDDTSMALCALESLAKGNVNYDDIMKNFGKWYYLDEFTPEGYVFDIGNTCREAIDNYFYRKKPAISCGLSSISSNGNGSLMRIHPFVLYAYYNGIEDEAEFINMIVNASSLTHAHKCSIAGCVIYSYILRELLNNPEKSSVHKGIDYAQSVRPFGRYYERVFSGNIETLKREDINSSGYVVDSLEAAIWCLLTTNNYEECVLKAVNLGEDTDTVAAIAGSLAGALYGIESIPEKWMEQLKKKEYIEGMCKNAYERWCIYDA
jgi:ADP-ribosylglycohydrolase